MKNAAAIVSHIAPSVGLRGQEDFVLAIYYTSQYLKEGHLRIRMMHDVYRPIALSLGKGIKAVEKAVSRAATACWMDGENAALNAIIGRKLALRPKPSEIVLYCAYYLHYGVPYHQIPLDISMNLQL